MDGTATHPIAPRRTALAVLLLLAVYNAASSRLASTALRGTLGFVQLPLPS